jgi:UDP-3-O-[3-hydroxymyristoyl] glucosamine N-acyltransferase
VKASAIAQAVNGRLEGGSDPELTGAAPLDHAAPSDLTLLSSARYAGDAAATAAGAVLVTEDLVGHLPVDLPRIIVRDVHGALSSLLPLLYPQPRPTSGVHPTAIVERGVSLGSDITIGAGAVIGAGSRIGDRVVLGAHTVVGRLCRIDADAYLHAHVTLYDGVVVGARSILHAGVRAGVDGFGYSHREGRHVKVPQVGRCVIGADVEIGANTCIDRGSIGSTAIGDGCKIDNLVHIAHNVHLGEHCIVVAQTGIAGSTRAGRYVTFGGQAGINGHIAIGDGATIAAQSGVFGDVPAGTTVSGYPARPHRESLRAQAGLFRLPELMKRLRALERVVLGKDTADS